MSLWNVIFNLLKISVLLERLFQETQGDKNHFIENILTVEWLDIRYKIYYYTDLLYNQHIKLQESLKYPFLLQGEPHSARVIWVLC